MSKYASVSALIALLLLIGLGVHTRSLASSRSAPAPAISTATDASRAVARLDSQIGVATRQAEAHARSAAPLTRLAAFHVARARLTGHYADYLSAERALDQAFERSGPAGGPHLARARLHFTLHRLDDARRELELATPGLDINFHVAKLDALRGEIALASGEYADARQALLRSEAVHATSESAFRLGLLAEQTGAMGEADRLYAQAFERTPASARQPRAAILRRRGLLSLKRGRYDDAETLYRQSDELFSGDFRTLSRRAELLALRGHVQEALGILRRLAEETDEPELMDAVADIYRARGNRRAAEPWFVRASARYEERMALLPEATLGHALRHTLAGEDAGEALELARRNVALRPGGEERILLAQALAKVGQLEQARSVLVEVAASPFQSAELFATQAVVLRALGEGRAASAAQARAEALRPDAMDQLAWLEQASGANSGH
ncbi:MAG: hypothetical protein GXP55_09525 [Deltaproteobacteria bacterium]|nr:hypothetical protein [Deltaproteobacteria bacterium]